MQSKKYYGPKPIIYEDAKTYYDSPEYPVNSSNEQAFVPGGMLLAWLIKRDLISRYFKKENQNFIKDFQQGKISGPKIYKSWGGRLTSFMLNFKGNQFLEYYLQEGPVNYFKDYEKYLLKGLDNIFEISDTQQNYKIAESFLDQRFKEWQRKTRKWWEFWKLF
ncbi:MAG: hypothetical protein GF347_04065 [Candidatus Moranbacteria bacterium]|nr:hypothetical protein [Candidatus Moranbacteria bacterium]